MSDEDIIDPKNIDKLIHEPARLMIMTQLFVVEEADVLYLKRKTGLTWGNISSHMTKLEDAGYIEIEKTIEAKKSHTVLRLTTKGRVAYREYRKIMDEVLKDLPNE